MVKAAVAVTVCLVVWWIGGKLLDVHEPKETAYLAFVGPALTNGLLAAILTVWSWVNEP